MSGSPPLIVKSVERGRARLGIAFENPFEQIENRAAPGKAQHFEDGRRGQVALPKGQGLIEKATSRRERNLRLRVR